MVHKKPLGMVVQSLTLLDKECCLVVWGYFDPKTGKKGMWGYFEPDSNEFAVQKAVDWYTGKRTLIHRGVMQRSGSWMNVHFRSILAILITVTGAKLADYLDD
jgi:hypothetical protein